MYKRERIGMVLTVSTPKPNPEKPAPFDRLLDMGFLYFIFGVVVVDVRSRRAHCTIALRPVA